jgi:hypothetical protein
VIPDGWRTHAAGRHKTCSKRCQTEFALAELARLEGHLKKISSTARGMAKDMAVNALYSNAKA